MRNFSDRQIIAIMLAASFASTIGGLPFNALPILLGTLADTFHLSPQQAGLLRTEVEGIGERTEQDGQRIERQAAYRRSEARRQHDGNDLPVAEIPHACAPL